MVVRSIIVSYIILCDTRTNRKYNIKITQYILSKIVKPKLIPKLDFQNGIPENIKQWL